MKTLSLHLTSNQPGAKALAGLRACAIAALRAANKGVVMMMGAIDPKFTQPEHDERIDAYKQYQVAVSGGGIPT